jgi:hypothetical protein
MADTRRKLHQLLKGKQLNSALYGLHTEVLHDLMAVLQESAVKGETTKATITAPLSTHKFSEQRWRKWKPTDDADERVKISTVSTTGVNDTKL